MTKTLAAIEIRGFGGTALPDRDALLAAGVRWPQPSLLERPLELSGKAADGAAALGLETVGDLLEHLPRARRDARTVAELHPGETATVIVEVRSIAQRPVRRRGMRPLVEATVADASGPMKAAFFNQPWLAQRYRPGTRLVLHGKYEARNRFRVASHAVTDETVGAASEVSHYPATEGLSSTQILALVRAARPALAEVPEPLPGLLRARLGLPGRAAALEAMHFEAGDSEAARRRLAFDELLLTQLVLLRRRVARRGAACAPALAGPSPITDRWLGDRLPFTPTGDQAAAIAEIRDELASEQPMQRLLMGEVGSGKTLVALFVMLRAAETGHQAAFMTPTETLAEQHFGTVQELLGDEPLPLALLTGSTTAARRADVLAKLASGELAMVIGTHALIEPDVRFARLGAAVVDEQHRFGVRQRAALDDKGPSSMVPHVLHMTATPIPRTLALCAYGDLDQTRLRELPRGRQPITTHVVSGERERLRAYERIREELRAGRQAFVVCPLVEESELAEARAATAEFERLRAGELADHRLVLMHGQMTARDRQAAMTVFAAGEADVLVATTVIEVGIDVPNATVMVVENAERFGISQLHQLRGRVGRGQHASLCLLFGPKQSARLQALASHSDGFALAEIDLELRKEGELTGTRQSGTANFAVAELPEDEPLLVLARDAATAIVDADAELSDPEHALLREALAKAHGDETTKPLAA